jgi:putative transposase
VRQQHLEPGGELTKDLHRDAHAAHTTPASPKTENDTLFRYGFDKLRNVTDRLPDAVASTVAKRMRRAYHHTDPLGAQAELEALARELDRSHPGAAASLREGLAETLTILRLGVPPTLARTLRSTNSIWVLS